MGKKDKNALEWRTYPDEMPIAKSKITEYLVRGISTATNTKHYFVFQWVDWADVCGWFYGGQEANNFLKEPFEYIDVDKL